MKPSNSLENGAPPKKKSKKKKVKGSSMPQNGAEKATVKLYPKFTHKSIKTMWDQHDVTETEISPEVYVRLAEDLSYRMMEISNNIKTYSKHSGGLVTYDLVNDVLKDSNIAPVCGSNDLPWDFIRDDDGIGSSIFYNRDVKLDLTGEYNKHVTMKVNGPIVLNTSWMLDEKIDEEYSNFYSSISDAIFTGDKECKEFALNIISTSPHVTGLVRHFLMMWINKIALNYSTNMLNRSMLFLSALIRNPYSYNNDMNTELKHVCQLLTNLLVGSVNDEIMENGHDNEIASDYPTYDPSIITFDSSNGIMENDKDINLNDLSTESNMDTFDESNGIIMENHMNFNNDFEPHDKDLGEELLEGFELVHHPPNPKLKLENHEEGSKDSTTSTRSLVEKTDEDEELNFEFSTKKCDKKFVDTVCEMFGMCAAKWSGVENLLTILLINEVENYFKINKKMRSEEDYEWLQRIIRGLWSLGEFAFREMLVYFEKIDTESILCPAYFTNYLNFSAIYIRGKHDIFFYEFLYDVCGDKVLPFLIYYSNFLLRLDKKHYITFKKRKNNNLSFIIRQKVTVKVLKRQLVGSSQVSMKIGKVFDECPKIIPKAPAKIIFRFPGCNPILSSRLKKGMRQNKKVDVVVEKREAQNPELLKKFNEKIVIAHQRLIKPVTNHQRYRRFENLHFMNL